MFEDYGLLVASSLSSTMFYFWNVMPKENVVSVILLISTVFYTLLGLIILFLSRYESLQYKNETVHRYTIVPGLLSIMLVKVVYDLLQPLV